MSQSEIKIHDLCNRFAKELFDRKWELSEEITQWRDTQIRRIDNHAREQRRLLEEEYQKQESYLNNTRDQFVTAAQRCEQTRDNVQIEQLLVQCNALKCELAALEFPEDKMLFIKFMTEDQLAQKKRNERNAEKNEDNKSRNKSGGDYDNYNASSTGAYGDSPSKLTSTTFKQI
jgi:hypothetical protein